MAGKTDDPYLEKINRMFDNNKHRCRVCNERFRTKMELKKHKNLQHAY
jgi:hypothetical protein